MFRQISWYTYLEFTAVVLVIYYAAVFIVYYRSQVTKLQLLNLFGKTTTITNTKMKPGIEEIDSLLEEIQLCMHQAEKNRSQKEEILFAVHGLINAERFRGINKQSFKNMINDFVSKAFENIYSTHLDEEDLIVLWT